MIAISSKPTVAGMTTLTLRCLCCGLYLLFRLKEGKLDGSLLFCCFVVWGVDGGEMWEGGEVGRGEV